MSDWFKRLKASFVLWSQRLNVFASAIVMYLVTYPTTLTDAAGYVPEQYRPFAGFLAGLGTFLVVSWTRLHKQAKLSDAK